MGGGELKDGPISGRPKHRWHASRSCSPNIGRRLNRLTTQGKSHTPRCQTGHHSPLWNILTPRSSNATTANLTTLPSLRNCQRLPTNHIRDHHDQAAMRSPAFAHTASTRHPPLVPTVPSTTADQPVNTVQAIRPRRKQYHVKTPPTVPKLGGPSAAASSARPATSPSAACCGCACREQRRL